MNALSTIFAAVRSTSPLVHCISNQVAANDCANLLLACGASPIMADAPEETAEVTAISRAVTLSLGTPSPRKAEALLRSGQEANRRSIPVVFDPVGVGVSGLRREAAKQLLAAVRPAVIRCNHSELRELCGGAVNRSGVDEAPSEESSLREDAEFAAAAARKLGCTVAMTGSVDVVTDGVRTYLVHNGTPLMRRVTGTGCMLTALTGAFAAADPAHPLEAALGAVCAMGLCGQKAEKRMAPEDGTGSYRVYLMDAVSNLTPQQLEEGSEYELYR